MPFARFSKTQLDGSGDSLRGGRETNMMASARNRADTTLLLAQDGCLGWVLHAPICSSKHASIGLLTLYSRINKQHSGIRGTAVKANLR